MLRYRRIPHVWVTQFSPERGLPKPRVELLPQLVLPRDDGTLEACTDSTLIRRLEAMCAGRAGSADRWSRSSMRCSGTTPMNG